MTEQPKPKHYESYEAAHEALDERFSYAAKPAKSLNDGTLKLDEPVIIPPDPDRHGRGLGVLVANPWPVVADPSKNWKKTRIRAAKPECAHYWRKWGKDNMGRQRVKCRDCGTVALALGNGSTA